MQEAITLALNMAGGRNRQDLTSDPMLAMALTRCLDVLGEAASKLSAEVRLQFPGIPYSKMIAMRNRLIHAYFDVDPITYCWFSMLLDLNSTVKAPTSR